MPYDGALLRSNVAVYLMLIVCWTPLIAASAMGISRQLPLRLYNQLEWLAMAKSCLNPFVYAVCNKHFREAFVSLFTYCCCKTSVSFSRRVRGPTLTLAHSYSMKFMAESSVRLPDQGNSPWFHADIRLGAFARCCSLKKFENLKNLKKNPRIFLEILNPYAVFGREQLLKFSV